MIKDLVKRLKENGLIRPRFEEEVANTYPLSILSTWERFSETEYLVALEKKQLCNPQIYVHIPFCSSRCAYCFYDITLERSQNEQEKYIKNVSLEMGQKKVFNQVASIYFGGGTPTKLNKG